MKQFIFPEYVNVYEDVKAQRYSKRWVLPFTRAQQHKLRVVDESWVWWIWMFGPMAFIFMMLFSVAPPMKNVTVYEIK